MLRSLRRFRLLTLGLLLAFAASSCIVTPVTGPGSIKLVSGFDVGLVGYQSSEFFLTGIATSYGSTNPLTADGLWDVEQDPALVGYRTRMVTYRPSNPAAFNGTVIVEWLNVTAGFDLANDWVMSHPELVRDGYAWVGVSAQSVGVNQLKTVDPARYNTLNHPGDSYSYDMFTQAGQRIRANRSILGGLIPQKVIATGESQSASRLVTYVNAFAERYGAFDGYMVHSRGGGGSSLRQAPLGSVVPASPTFIRDDLDTPVMVLQAEGDVLGSSFGARQPDTSKFRWWEMAGTSHADAYLVNVGFGDLGNGAGEQLMFDFMRTPLLAGCTDPVNAGPHTWIMRAAIDHLDTWVRTGVAPPSAPLLDVVSVNPVVLDRDAQGNALGGIRTPHVDAPVARIDGIGSGPAFCRLYGSTTPLTTAQLTALYPTHQDFVTAWNSALDDAVAAGFILPADDAPLRAAAAASTVPN